MGIHNRNRRRSNKRVTFDTKVQNLFTACFAPIQNCGSDMSMEQHINSKSPRESSRARQRDSMWKMGQPYKNHLSDPFPTDRRFDEESVLTRGKAETLITELTLEEVTSTQSETDSSESGSSDTHLNTIGVNTLANMEKMDRNGQKNVQAIKHLPNSYKDSVRSKFDYYRKHQTFGEVETGSTVIPEEELPPNFQKLLADASKITAPSPSSRRNMSLAKAIIQRRKNHPATPSRSGADP